MGIKKSTAYRWVKQQGRELQRGGRRVVKILPEHHSIIENYIEANPRITLKEIKENLEHSHQLSEPENANSEQNKIKRRCFAQQLMIYQADNMPIIYLDETNFNLFISRSKGRSKKGTRCTHVSAGCKGANVHLIGCIGNMGLIHHEIRKGAFKKPEAMDFVRQCLRSARNMYQSNVVLIIDNAPCHASIEEVFLEKEFEGHRLLRLAPYSPMLNAIEYVWSSLKADVKKELAEQMPSILLGEDNSNMTQTQYRMQRLEQVLVDKIKNITVDKCVKYIANIQRFLPDALNMMDVRF
uniref:DDE_3 domain-containing protein n=1 Tax=Strongyloides stercoralis TaxID=6248 RepID=A0A0K0EC41_STRER